MSFIRSSSTSISLANVGKRSQIKLFIDEYRKCVQHFIDQFWNLSLKDIPIMPNTKGILFNDLTATAVQSAAASASDIVRSTKKSMKGKASATALAKMSSIMLDERFVDIDMQEYTDGAFRWITLTKFSKSKRGNKIHVPFKLNGHLKKQLKDGTLRNSIQISSKKITFLFERSAVHQCAQHKTLGIDSGISDVITISDGQRPSQDHPDGWNLSKILKRLSRRKKGSKGFKRAQTLRDNFIGWSVNRLNFDNVEVIKVENIKGLRKNKKCDRFRSHWTYTKIYDRLNRRAEERDVRVLLVDPWNTSRKCSACFHIDIKSRKGKRFKCVACGHAQDADLNAALNIELSDVLTSRVRRGETLRALARASRNSPLCGKTSLKA